MIRTNKELIPAPIGGLNYSQAGDEILPLEMSGCQNVSVQDGLIQKRHGYKLFGGNLPLSGPLMGFDQYRKMSGATYLLAMTTKDIYRWNSTNKEWDLLTEHTSIDDCDDDPAAWTASANVTAEFEDTIKKEGDGSIKLTLAADFTTGLAAYHDKAIGDITAYNHLRLWIRSSVALDAGDFQILLDDTAACASPLRELDLPAVAADTWTQALLDLRVEGSVADLSAIASIGLKGITDVGACVIYLDQFDVYDCFTGSDTNYFSFDHIRKADQADMWWCCSNGKDNIKKYDGDTIADLAASAPKAALLRQFKDYLFALDTIEGGNPMHQRARNPDTADPTNWDTGNASYKDLPGSDWIKQALRYKGDYMVVLKDGSLWLGYASNDSDIFRFDNKVPEIGCASSRSAVCLDEQIVFLGWDDFYTFDGIEAEDIGGLIRKELFRSLNTEQIERAFGVEMDDDKEYWLHIASTNADYPDIAWVLNRQSRRWTRHKFAEYFTAYGHYYIEGALRVGDLTMKIRDMTWRIGDRRLLSMTPTVLFGDKDGNVYEYSPVEANDNGAAIDAWFDTKDFNPAGPDARGRAVRLDVYYTGGSLDVYYSKDKGSSWTLLKTLATSATMELPQTVKKRIDFRQIRWRFRNNQIDQTFIFQRAVMYWQKAGARLNA